MPVDRANLAAAISAYRGLAQTDATDKAASSEQQSKTSFAGELKTVMRAAIAQGKGAEHLSAAAAFDKADLNKVVTAVAEAETTLKTVVSIRDKMVEAYKDILRMPM